MAARTAIGPFLLSALCLNMLTACGGDNTSVASCDEVGRVGNNSHAKVRDWASAAGAQCATVSEFLASWNSGGDVYSGSVILTAMCGKPSGSAEGYPDLRATPLCKEVDERCHIADGVGPQTTFDCPGVLEGRAAPSAIGDDPGADPDPGSVPPDKAKCSYIPDGSTPSRDVGTPPKIANAAGKYKATLLINKKPVVIELDAAAAPCAVNSFVYLAKAKYFDNTECHRELNSPGTYVLQCGDPDATGTGGPGYSFVDENLEGASYEAGVVAMANAGPDSNGSQFFMMFKDSDFPPAYVPFGKIVSGLNVLLDIARAGTTLSEETGANDVPKNKVVISTVRVVGAEE